MKYKHCHTHVTREDIAKKNKNITKTHSRQKNNCTIKEKIEMVLNLYYRCVYTPHLYKKKKMRCCCF